MNQYCQAWESPRKVVAEFTSWINKAPNNTPRNEPRPPNRLAPPSTTAATLPSVYSTPWFGSPIPSCDITITPPSTVNKDEARKGPTITQEFGCRSWRLTPHVRLGVGARLVTDSANKIERGQPLQHFRAGEP